MSLIAVIPASIPWLLTQVSSCWNNLPTLTIFLILFALLLDYWKRKRWSHCPPGPAALPFVGNLLLFDRKKPYSVFQHMWEKFGAVSLFQIGWTNVILLNGFKVINEALGQKAENFIDRPAIPLLKVIGHGKNYEGLLIARSSCGWREQRRLFVSTLKNFGIGKKTLEKTISEEAEYLCSEFKSSAGSFFDPHNMIFRAVGNIISTLLFGDRSEYNDETFLRLIHLVEAIMKGLTGILPQLAAAGTWLTYFPGPHHKVQESFDDISVIIREFVTEHKRTRNPTVQRDFIDAFLDEIEKAKGNPESSFSEQNLPSVVFELFGAGLDTTATTILWGLLYLVLHPEVQKRAQEEIDTVIGKVKSPMMKDQSKLPYTNAVIHEIQRCADVVPIAIPLETVKDTEVGNFVIPKETVIFNHLSVVLKDETMWEKPHEFYPEHFLDANGQFVKQEAFLPFSAGRHVCPGELLAKMELFIFMTSLLQHFSFCVPENCPRPKEDRIFVLTVHPLPFQICAVLR